MLTIKGYCWMAGAQRDIAANVYRIGWREGVETTLTSLSERNAFTGDNADLLHPVRVEYVDNGETLETLTFPALRAAFDEIIGA